MQTTKPASHIPPGFRAVTPYFIVDEPERLVAFAKAAFGAEELQDQRALDPDGKLLHTASDRRLSARDRSCRRPLEASQDRHPPLCLRRGRGLCPGAEGRWQESP